jgi:hypothetical protein
MTLDLIARQSLNHKNVKKDAKNINSARGTFIGMYRADLSSFHPSYRRA